MSQLINDINNIVNSFEEPFPRDFHSVYTIQLGELIEGGFDWGKELYFPEWEVNNENRIRLNNRIEEHFFFKEICSLPPLRFKHLLLKNLNLILYDLKPTYDMIDKMQELNITFLDGQELTNKQRIVNSEFPQEQLSGGTDYADNLKDSISTLKTTKDPLETYFAIASSYKSLDNLVLEAIDKCFIGMISSQINY